MTVWIFRLWGINNIAIIRNYFPALKERKKKKSSKLSKKPQKKTTALKWGHLHDRNETRKKWRWPKDFVLLNDDFYWFLTCECVRVYKCTGSLTGTTIQQKSYIAHFIFIVRSLNDLAFSRKDGWSKHGGNGVRRPELCLDESQCAISLQERKKTSWCWMFVDRTSGDLHK